VLGIALAVVWELSRAGRFHWDLDVDDLRRLWNVTALLFLGSAMYLFFANEGWGAVTTLATSPGQAAEPLRNASQGLLTLLQWMPIVLFGFLLACSASGLDRIPWESVSPLLHARRLKTPARAVSGDAGGFRPFYPYLLLVLFTASADATYPNLFFPALAGLTTWALWPFRSRRYAGTTWSLTLATIALAAFFGQRGMLEVYRQLESWESRLLNQWGQANFDARGVRTDLESVRRSKGSPRIVMRLSSPSDSPPGLLREGVYTLFASPYWNASRREFQPVAIPVDGESWRLSPPVSPADYVTVLRYAQKGAAALALPAGAFELLRLPVGVIETNRLGSVRVDGAPKLLEYDAWFAPAAGWDGLPDEDDVNLDRLREEDQSVVLQVSEELGLGGLHPREVMAAIEQFFLQNFRYSLETPPPSGQGVLYDFLLRSRVGHCEFYATATTLLLRSAGIPSRYVVGWSVQEKQGDYFVVRGRHAHVWSQAFVDGRWITVDNTPGSWSEMAANSASWWEPFYDRISLLWLEFTLWRQGNTQWRLYVFMLGSAVLAYMAWRELRGGRWRRRRSARRQKNFNPRDLPGTDSEFFALLQTLETRFAPRPPSTPPQLWLRQLLSNHPDEFHAIEPILQLHYQLRFDPQGLTSEQRDILREYAAAWLRKPQP
jgi:transglutaminase-like putative cysteine protease/membrane protein implicated in regulation of membrane protease activity